MSKKQINEKQLLTEARAWFEQKYKKSPRNCGIKFIQIWHKPTPFRKTTAVVFAPTEEIGKAFIWEQNAIFRSMSNFWIVVVCYFIFAFIFIHTLSQQDEKTAMAITIFFTALCGCAAAFFLFLGKKCKKLEKIHQWNVEVYYPQQ
ncbi:MAG: hypothetical protein NC218_00440 [Acetobacter sp.]|nr:hypothetical protein [Acetobacter sp.]